MQLNDRCCTTMRPNCRLCCSVPLLRRFEIRSALIDAFATFLVLAYVKIGYTSVSIFEPTVVYTPDGACKLYVYVDASMENMGTEHLKYAFKVRSSSTFHYCDFHTRWSIQTVRVCRCFYGEHRNRAFKVQSSSTFHYCDFQCSSIVGAYTQRCLL